MTDLISAYKETLYREVGAGGRNNLHGTNLSFDELASEVIALASEITGYTPSTIFGGTNHRPYCRVRQAIVWALKRHPGANNHRIARALGLGVSNVRAGYERAVVMRDYDYAFRVLTIALASFVDEMIPYSILNDGFGERGWQ